MVYCIYQGVTGYIMQIKIVMEFVLAVENCRPWRDAESGGISWFSMFAKVRI